jgi:hypothetical protein
MLRKMMSAAGAAMTLSASAVAQNMGRPAWGPAAV